MSEVVHAREGDVSEGYEFLQAGGGRFPAEEETGIRCMLPWVKATYAYVLMSRPFVAQFSCK
jgi:hypothetical protein